MAKGDDSRARNRVQEQGGQAQNTLNNLRNDTIVPQNQYFWNQMVNANADDKATANNLMSGYQSYLGQNPYGEFINNGGYSPADVANIRARAISPSRAIYQQGVDDINRQSRLNKNSGINKNAAIAKLGRETTQGMSDSAVNANAAIAQMINQGKQFGTSGEVNRQLATRDAMKSLYGTTPGMSQMFGNQVLQSTNQQLQLQELQNAIANMMINGQINAGQLTGKGGSILGGLKDVSQIYRNFTTY